MNTVHIIGNLTRDPESRTVGSGSVVANFAVAVNRRWRDRQTGEAREEATFIDCEAWGRTAETVCQYLSKGRQVAVEGRLKMDSWEDRETGQKRSKLKVVAERVHFIGSRDGGGGAQQQHDEQIPQSDIPF